MSRRKIEAEREQMGLADPAWTLFSTEGPTLEEIVASRVNFNLPVSKSIWTKEGGWKTTEGE